MTAVLTKTAISPFSAGVFPLVLGVGVYLFDRPWHQLAIAGLILLALAPSFTHVVILDRTPTYFLSGTFDPLDLLLTTLGALTGYIVLEGTNAQGVGHEA